MNPPPRVDIDPVHFEAVIFDMDGVITDTARTHLAAWTQLFDEFLAGNPPAGADTRPFTAEDYRAHVDGRSRIDGIKAFLAARRVSLPRGTPEDPSEASTSSGLANRKNHYFLASLEHDPPRAFPSTLALLDALVSARMRTAVVTASRNRGEVLAAAGVADRFDAHVDGNDAATLGLAGKPAPDLFVEAAQRLGVDPAQAVVVEDASAGVRAAASGGFGLVIGVDRTGHAEELRAAGAHVVVADLAEVTVVGRRERPGGVARRPAAAEYPAEWQFRYSGFAPADEGRREAL